jgi:predicted nucleotide-binding protein
MTNQGGRVTHHGSGNISVGNSGTQTQGDNSPITLTQGADSPITISAPVASAEPEAEPHPAKSGGPEPSAPDPDISRNVFVVHGRDLQAAEAVFELLRTLDLVPLDWEQLVAGTGQALPFLGDVVHRAPAQARAALVLFTPDDVVNLHPTLHGPEEPFYETRPTGQPRPNVLIELGMVLMAYPERTVLVEAGAIRPISDIAGRNVVKFDGSELAAWKIAERLKVAGCRVDDRGLTRLRMETLQDWDAYRRRPEGG